MRYLEYHENTSHGSFDFPLELYTITSSHSRYEMPFHWHVEYEFMHVSRGSFHLSLEGREMVIKEGTAILIPGGFLHGGTPSDCEYECIVFDLERFLQSGSICHVRIPELLSFLSHTQLVFKDEDVTGRLILKLIENVTMENPGYEFICTGLIWQLVGELYRLHTSSEYFYDKESRRSSQIKAVLRRIRKDYASSLTLSELAKEAGLAPGYLCRIFKQVTGRSPVDYLNYYRIECAAELLCSSDMNITEISLSCGFNDISYFTRVFKACKGMNAHEYRKQHLSLSEGIAK